jgi:homoserine O-acetyltransferase
MHEDNFVIQKFRFNSGESLDSLRIHYATVGTLHRNSRGMVDNAVLLLHSRGGAAQSFLSPEFGYKDELFQAGGLLDLQKYFLIMPDSIGAGQSSKPSNGLRTQFPHFDYDDMVRAQHELVAVGLHIDHLRLILGNSMGCGHAFLWGEKYPDFMDAIMPMSCEAGRQPVRTQLMVTVMDDFIRNDPAWMGGNYKVQPQQALRALMGLSAMIGDSPIQLEKALPTAADAYPMSKAVDNYLEAGFNRAAPTFDANDYLYLNEAVRDFNTGPRLNEIKAYVMWINAADDFINPDVGIDGPDARKIKHGRLVVLPASNQTHGHMSYRYPELWKGHLKELLEESEGTSRR